MTTANFTYRLHYLFYGTKEMSKTERFSSSLFLCGLLVKIILSFLFASDYLTKLFCPFVNYFVTSGFSNPYTFFWEKGIDTAFPYPPLMLWLLSIPRWIFTAFLSNDYTQVSFLHVFLLRLPLLVSDLTILIILLRWLKNHSKKIIILYWLSPVLIYINYIHGQLDVIPIAFLFVSLYFLFKERYILASVFLALSVSTKSNILLVVPFYFIYGLKSKDISLEKGIKILASFTVIVVLIYSSMGLDAGFVAMVLQNKEQIKVYDFKVQFSQNLMFYFTPACFLILIVYFTIFKSLNKDLFISFLGFAFSLLAIFIPPMPGWYYWFLPFFIFFFAKKTTYESLIIHCLTIFYLLYFLLIPKSDLWNVFQLISNELALNRNVYDFINNSGFDANLVLNISFSLLQTTLLLNCLVIFAKGVNSNLLHKLKYKPFLIGISGDSGAGKSTISSAVQRIFKEKNTSILKGDDMHKWERGHEMWKKYTHLNPKANHLHYDLSNMLSLKFGKKIYRKQYDHDYGAFTLPQKIQSNKLILFEGLHTFYLKSARDLLDLKIFIKPQEELRLHWKIKRDKIKRGYTKDQVVTQIENRKEDSKKYIQVQESFADIIISPTTDEKIENLGIDDREPTLHIILKIKSYFFLEPLVVELDQKSPLKINHYYDESEYQILEIRGTVDAETIDSIALDLIPELEEFGINDVDWDEDFSGVIQLFITYCIFYKVTYENLNV